MSSGAAAGAGGKKAAAGQQQHEHLVCVSAAERNALAGRSLIYRDVKAFLNEVGGDPREARYWLTQFQRATSAQSHAFAVLEVKRPLTPSEKTGYDLFQQVSVPRTVCLTGLKTVATRVHYGRGREGEY